jgi:hypothetical protein
MMMNLPPVVGENICAPPKTPRFADDPASP